MHLRPKTVSKLKKYSSRSRNLLTLITVVVLAIIIGASTHAVFNGRAVKNTVPQHKATVPKQPTGTQSVLIKPSSSTTPVANKTNLTIGKSTPTQPTCNEAWAAQDKTNYNSSVNAAYQLYNSDVAITNSDTLATSTQKQTALSGYEQVLQQALNYAEQQYQNNLAIAHCP